MYCRFCGRKLAGEEKFCPWCGKALDLESKDSSFSAQSKQNQNGNWKDYLSFGNIERFAPAAALVPLAMALVVGVIGGLILLLLNYHGIAKVIVSLLKVIFCAGALGATAGLIYVAIKVKTISNVYVWVAPAATLLAFISCLGIAFSWSVVAWIFGILSFVIGLELLARITIAGNPMESPIDPKAAFATYHKYYEEYRAKYPTTKDIERNQIADPRASYFDGSGLELLGYTLLAILVSLITCGIAAPWMICKLYNWELSHTVVNGKRLTFNGTGASLLGHWIIWEILTVITCGIYSFFAHVALRKWEVSHTYIDGEPVVPDGKVSYFDGNSFEYFGYSLLAGLLICLTCGIAYPWVMCMLQKWDTKHQIVNGHRLVFSGSGLGFLGEYIIIFLLSVITCGIYVPWGRVRETKYIIRHTDFMN